MSPLNKYLHNTRQNTRSGFTLLYALVVVGLLLTVGSSIFGIMIKELKLAQFGQESQTAYYAAESGVECALFWGLTENVFVVGGIFECNRDSANGDNAWNTASICVSDVCTFRINFREDAEDVHYPCALVTVNTSAPETVVQSRGYNTCADNFPRRVERGVQAVF
jgi:hypothetical protein